MASIPIENIFYLLCYAWDYFVPGQKIRQGVEKATTPLDLFARILVEGVRLVRRRGLDRGYQIIVEETQRPRGRLLVGETIKRNLLSHGIVVHEADELSYDVLHNRILKSTLARLLDIQDLDIELKDELSASYQLLSGVSEIRVSSGLFKRICLHQGNRFYGLLMEVCRMIHLGIIPRQALGNSRFIDFVEHRMGELFETFVKNFLRREQNIFKVQTRLFNWALEGLSPNLLPLLPVMKPDICLDSPQKKIIIECKFYQNLYVGRYGTKKLRQSHLFQLYGYLKTIEREQGWDACDGVLLYAQPDEELDESFTKEGHSIRIVTLDLNQHWKIIHNNLLQLFI